MAFDPARREITGESAPIPLPVTTTAAGAVNAAFSSAGMLVYAPGGAINAIERRLVWVDRQGREELIESEPHPFAVPRASPDGSRVVSHLDYDPPDVAVFDIRRQSLLRLTLAGRFRMSATAAGRSSRQAPSGRLWSRDGTELFYLTGRGMMSVTLEGTRTFQWSSPKPLFNAIYAGFPGLAGPRNYDLSPDGKRFLVIKDGATSQQTSELVVVENWFEELKKLAPPK